MDIEKEYNEQLNALLREMAMEWLGAIKGFNFNDRKIGIKEFSKRFPKIN
jgi:hypothetical protein